MFKLLRFLILSLLYFSVLLSPVFAAPPKTINYQGYLTNAIGVPVDAPLEIHFSIYNVATGGEPLWSETQSVTVTNGVYSVVLGAGEPTPAPIELPFDAPYYLGVRIGTDPELDPRQPLTSVPYAFHAAEADQAKSLAAGAVTAESIGIDCPIGAMLVKTAGGWGCATPPQACYQGDYVNCYSGVAVTNGVGACRAGTRSCVEGGSGYGSCAGEVLPQDETCDAVDNDCNGSIDDHPVDGTTWYLDSDADKFGDSAVNQVACSAPESYVATAGDCNNDLSSIRPGMASELIQINQIGGVEICDSLDNNCNGSVDEECATTACSAVEIANLNKSSLQAAACLNGCGNEPGCMMVCASDFIGPGDCGFAVIQVYTCLMQNNCVPPDGQIENACVTNFCNSEWTNAFGPVPAICDNGAERACGSDVGECSLGTQTCSGGNWGGCEGSVGPGAEICSDGKDNDCDGTIDNPRLWYADIDSDGFVDMNNVVEDCAPPAGYFPETEFDCDDSNAAIHPGAVEICDTRDNDCDGMIDNNVVGEGAITYYWDNDGDGYGGLFDQITSCDPLGGNWVTNLDDCNDEDPAVYIVTTWYQDNDADGFGAAGVPFDNCGQPGGFVANSNDCNDNAATSNPDGVEVCDGVDNNCDGAIDEGVGSQWYQDADNDGFGELTVFTLSCLKPAGFVADSTDCNDSDPLINPNAIEVCNNGIDSNCNPGDESTGSIWYQDYDADGIGFTYATVQACAKPDGFVATGGDCDDGNASLTIFTWYRDFDADGYGNSTGDTVQACSQPIGYVDNNLDCNDVSVNVYPSAQEVCDGIDNNCSGSIDEGAGPIWYLDADGDNYGNPLETTTACIQPPGYLNNNVDCDDTNAAITVFSWYADYDGDGVGGSEEVVACTAPTDYGVPFVAASGDCDDWNPQIYPGAIEICDGQDNNCNGQVDDNPECVLVFYIDADQDGYGSTMPWEEGMGGTPAPNNTDCDDADAAVNPGAPEICDDGADNNCNAMMDMADPACGAAP